MCKLSRTGVRCVLCVRLSMPCLSNPRRRADSEGYEASINLLEIVCNVSGGVGRCNGQRAGVKGARPSRRCEMHGGPSHVDVCLMCGGHVVWMERSASTALLIICSCAPPAASRPLRARDVP